MKANTGSKETARMEANVPMESGISSQGESGVGQQETSGMTGDAPVQSGTSSQEEANVGEQETPRVGGALPRLNPMAASFTPHSQAATTANPVSDTPTARPASPCLSTPPSLERFARELKELKSSGQSNKQRLAAMQDQRSQLLGHMATAKAEIERLEGQLQREESIEGSQEILNRLKELNGLYGWVAYKGASLGDEIVELEAEIAMPESREDEF